MKRVKKRLKAIAENMPLVYEAGMAQGGGDTEAAYNEGFDTGKQAERYAFWDDLQNEGNATTYFYGFSYSRWNDAIYNPVHPIVCSETTSSGQNVFYNSYITDTKVDIIANSLNINGMFYWAKKLKTIRKLVMQPTTTVNASTFSQCYELESITFEGTIGTDGLTLKDSTKLNKASLTSVVNCLSSTTSGLTVTLPLIAVDREFETSTGANDGSTSAEWLDLIAPKTDTTQPYYWIISLV